MISPGLSAKQIGSIRDASGRVNVWDGSIRSGKTIGSLLRWVIYVPAAPRGGELVIIGRTRDSAWRNVIAPLQDPALFGSTARHVIGNYGAPTVSILGRRVHVLGASDAKAELVIRGMTIAGSYVDEITTIPEQFFTQLLGRMSVPGAQLFGTTNPDNPAHWLKKKFLDRIGQLPEWRRFQFRLADNPSLTQRYITAISAEFTGLWYRRFILGEWVAAEGAIYPDWDAERHVLPWAQLPDMARLIGVGIDYGTTNATAALLLGISAEVDELRRPRPRLYLVDEWRHDPSVSNTRLTDAQLSAGMRDWLSLPHLPYPNGLSPEWIVIDPAAASFKVQLHHDGLTSLADADNDVSYGIRTVASLLGQHRLLVSDRCPGFTDEVTGYSWDPKATEKGEDKPLKVADHSLDAGRYILTTTEALWRPELRHLEEAA